MRRYKHNLSHYHLFSTDMGRLVPAGWIEVLPGDTIRGSTSVLTRCQPLVTPVMHPTQVRIHTFFAPLRILLPNWEEFIVNKNTQRQDAVPAIGEIWDYLGVNQEDLDEPTNPLVTPDSRLAYEKIFNEYYRDQEIDQEIDNTQSLQAVRWEKDFLTTARPNPQRGFAGVAPVVSNEVLATDIRKALADQRFEEARSRFGNRYTEYLQYLGVKPSDARLQRPEYIGGGSGQLQFSEVLQTSETTNTGVEQPLGQLGGHGIAVTRTRTWQRFFEEHGILMVMYSVRPKAVYTNGIDRKFWRRTADEYWQKENEHLGQEEILRRETFFRGDEVDDAPWGYQDRNYSYHQERSRVSGEFRNVLDSWHMARKFDVPPGLNTSFLRCVPSKRIFASSDTDTLVCAAHHKLIARRLVARNPNPRAI